MEVGKRYVEQIQTTVETMRRRFVAMYDLGVKVSKRSVKLAERAQEVGESSAYEFRDQLVQACAENEPLDAKDRETRNNLLELYLGVSVLLLGVSSGQLTGSSVLGALLEKVFDPFLELSLVFLLPAFVYLSFRKNAALDETEKRVWLFGLVFIQNALLGHLVGVRLIRAGPALFFLLPLVFALLTDYEISPEHLYSNRQNLFVVAAALGGGLSFGLASISLGLGAGIALLTVVHLAILGAHFQMVVLAMKNKSYGVSEAQAAYILALVFAQVVISLVFVSGGAGKNEL